MENFTFEDYCATLEGAGPKLKELILERAAHDTEAISFEAFIRLVQIAYPETMFGGAA